MKTYHKNRLLKLADFLDTLPKKKFDFSVVVTKGNVKNNHFCGTVCCAVGWTPTVFPRHWKWVGEQDYYGDGSDYSVQLKNTKNRKYSSWIDDAEKFFGLTEQECEKLFVPYSVRNWMKIPHQYLTDDATPKQVAESIRKFVQWKESQ